MEKSGILKKYPKTDKFEVIDTIGVPHPYCITPKHVQYAADFYSGLLGTEAIKEAEKHGATCNICKVANKKNGAKILSLEEHETALLIEVNDPRDLNDIPELKEYLLKIKKRAEEDKFAGFAFRKKVE